MSVLVFLLWSVGIQAQTTQSSLQDTLSVALSGVEITQRKPLKVLVDKGIPAYRVSADWVAGMPQFMGIADPVRVMQSLPAVATSSELTTGMFIQGCSDSHNRYEIDGAQVVNPSHMLGLFSTFNATHFSDFLLTPSGHGATASNFIGGLVKADTGFTPDTLWKATATVGIIDAHATVKAPLRRGESSLAVSVRQTFLDMLFPEAIKMNHAVLKYGFTDLNATFTQRVGREGALRANLFFSRDKMELADKVYDSDGRFGWENIVGSVGYEDPEAGNYLISYTRYHNRFFMREATMELRMPSAINVASFRGNKSVGSRWNLGVEVIGRIVEEQNPSRENQSTTSPRRSSSMESSVGAEWDSPQWGIFSATAGLRAMLYCHGGFVRLYPMPRFSAKLRLPRGMTADLSAGLYGQCSHLVKESTTGLPCDFWINASRRFRPQTARSVSVSLSSPLPFDFSFRLEGYYRNMSNLVEYTGSIFNMINQSGSPTNSLARGRGYSYGLSITVMRVYGPLQGWIGYNLGTSRVHIPELDNKTFPANHDRRHDLTATTNYRISDRFSVGANFVYASGTPYTQAKFGYMIGENLVCEYYPHNSSRLPAYKRLDLSFDWNISHGSIRQKINISLYNALFTKNIIFTYPTYSSTHGLRQREVGLKTLIPSVSYTISL